MARDRDWADSALAEASWREWRRLHSRAADDSAEAMYRRGWAAGRRDVLWLASLGLGAAFLVLITAIVLTVVLG